MKEEKLLNNLHFTLTHMITCIFFYAFYISMLFQNLRIQNVNFKMYILILVSFRFQYVILF